MHADLECSVCLSQVFVLARLYAKGPAQLYENGDSVFVMENIATDCLNSCPERVCNESFMVIIMIIMIKTYIAQLSMAHDR